MEQNINQNANKNNKEFYFDAKGLAFVCYSNFFQKIETWQGSLPLSVP